MGEVIFLKLGGSLLTDKTGIEVVRDAEVRRLAQEIAVARAARPNLALVLGHGGGSFGHVAAAAHGTRQGVAGPAQWLGFAEVHAAMVRLGRLLVEALLAADVPALALPPVALATCENGRIVKYDADPVQRALAVGLVPVVYGDVAFDNSQGGTIISTEMVLAALVEALQPSWLLLAGEVEGVYDANGRVVDTITPETLSGLQAALRGSRGTDVTGGMASKVATMVSLVQAHGGLSAKIFSGLVPGRTQQALVETAVAPGTTITTATL